ncbi:unnamed protein product [Aureobasidium mustum]|uniref:14-3-3 domain-containing protein n=1 Tax=Aureobasidium mustum TaxID=2773714 RepID=A0A9N8JYX0_9PEZI|nr:unnamed protein product [Aureobasidium mustum]
MALSQIERQVLSHSINCYVSENKIVVENLTTVLGLSLRLEEKLSEVRELRILDMPYGPRSLDPYRELIFLAKEGLALTEVYIAPYCGPSADGVYQVMALKFRATFHHIFCQYHNTPPVRLLRQKKAGGLSAFSAYYLASRQDQDFELAASPAPSVQSFVTNPYAPNAQAPVNDPSQTKPQSRTTPKHPPGINPDVVLQYEPPVSASTFLMPALDYTPETKRLFELATKCAEENLDPAHPLVLSLALERATFLIDCLADYEKAFKVVQKAARAAALRKKEVTEFNWADDVDILHNMTALIASCELVLQPKKRMIPVTPRIASPPLYPPPNRELPTPPRQRNGSARTFYYNGQHDASIRSDSAHGGADGSEKHASALKQAQQSPPGGIYLSVVQKPDILQPTLTNDAAFTKGGIRAGVNKSATRIKSPMNLDSQIELINKEILAHKKSNRSRSSGISSKSKGEGRRMEGTGTEKERKRRALERAEDELLRSRATSKASTPVGFL